jgi:hypothetical protein
MRRPSDWPIAACIAAAVAIPLLLVVGIGAKGLLSLQSLGAAAGRSGAAAEAALAAGDLHAGFLGLKVAVREYVARNSEARLRVAEEAHRRATAHARSEADRAALEAYWRGFAAIAALRTEAMRDAALRQRGTEMRAVLEGVDMPRAEEAMRRLLLMRAYADRLFSNPPGRGIGTARAGGDGARRPAARRGSGGGAAQGDARGVPPRLRPLAGDQPANRGAQRRRARGRGQPPGGHAASRRAAGAAGG